MSITEKLLLGVNTTIIGMGIVFLVLIILSLIIAVQSKLVNAFFKSTSSQDQLLDKSEEPMRAADKGNTTGETVCIGIEDEETIAIIMASVSHDLNLPLYQLKFKSIKAL